MEGTIQLDPTKTYSIPIKDGHLDISVSQDPNYPGLDVEFVKDNIPEDETSPRVLIEAPFDETKNEFDNLRVLIWADPKSEDYSDKIEFKKA